jgi:hypothetical protein
LREVTAKSRPLRVASAVGVLTLGLTLTACSSGATARKQPDGASTTSTSPRPAATTPTTSKSTPPSASELKASADKAVKQLAAHEPAHAVSVAALNTTSGARYSYGSASGHWTASVYKLFILEVLLHRRGGALTGSESSNAVPMIERSDNVAGYAEFLAAGGRTGLIAGAKALGLSHTIPGTSDPTFTTTGASDLLILLRNLVRKGPLTKAARAYALRLMRDVEPDQRWGVGVIADHDTDFANKNGWLSIGPGNAPGENDGGRWAVNSVGIVTVGGHQVLIAVMTQHQPDFRTGVKLVERLARAIRPAIAS